MGINSKAKDVGGVLFGFSILVVMFAIGASLLYGAAEISLWALQWTPTVLPILFWATILVMVPLALIPVTRGAAGFSFFSVSFVFGLILWIWAMAYTYDTWGLFAVIVGLGFLGFGIVPIAMLAALLNGHWSMLGGLAFLVFMTVVTRFVGAWLLESVEAKARDLAMYKASEQATPANRIIDQ